MAERERLIRVLKPGVGTASTVAWSPDGMRLAVGGLGGVAVMTPEGREIWRDTRDTVLCADWSHDGLHLAHGGGMHNLHVRGAATGSTTYKLTSGSAYGYKDVAWSPDDKLLAAAVCDENLVRIHDARTGLESLTFRGHTGHVQSVCWSPQADRMAYCSTDGNIRILDVTSGRQLFGSPECSTFSSNCVRWSPDGRQIAESSLGCIRLWDAESYHSTATLDKHKWFGFVAWAPNARYLAAGDHHGFVHLWDIANAQYIESLEGHSEKVVCVAFSPDGTRLASTSHDRIVRIWDTSDLAQRRAPAIDPPGTWTAAYVARQAATVGRGVADRTPTPTSASLVPHRPGAVRDCLSAIEFNQNYAGDPGRVAFSGDGHSLIIGGSGDFIRRQSLATGAVEWEVGGERRAGIVAMALSIDNRSIATGHTNGVVRTWGVSDGKAGICTEGHEYIWDICWSPDASRIATAGQDGTLRIIDSTTGRETLTIANNHIAVYGVSWSNCGQFIAIGNSRSGIQIWNTETGQLVRQHHHQSNDCLSVQWSPNNRILASGGGDASIYLWNMASTRELSRLQGHTRRIWCVLWSPDGNRLASGSADHTIRIWDPITGAELVSYDVPEHFTQRLAWSPDGTLLASSHPGGIFRLWDTRSTLPRTKVFSFAAPGPVPSSLFPLPGALAALLRLRRSAPLSLLRDLLSLTAGHTPPTDAAPLASHSGIRALASLHWPTPARVAFLLLLLRDHDDPTFSPPPDSTPADLRWLLLEALGGPPRESDAPPTPIAFLERALAAVDDRLLTLLSALGPNACADDPSLPLTLLARLPELLPLAAPDRHLLSIRVPSLASGHALGAGAGLERAGVASTGNPLHLLPSQWGLPDALRHYRALNGGLLYRAHVGREAPRLRPTVVVLDVSPTCFGPVERLLRTAAHAVGSTLLEAGLPAYLIAAGGKNLVRPLEQRADLLEVLAARSREPIDAARTLSLAHSLRQALAGDRALPPIILLLSQPWLGAEEDDMPAPPHLRALFVPYPGYPATPALERRCERSASLSTSEARSLGDVLAGLLA